MKEIKKKEKGNAYFNQVKSVILEGKWKNGKEKLTKARKVKWKSEKQKQKQNERM